jgi:tetratricopeptide (TPR) repeat protein
MTKKPAETRPKETAQAPFSLRAPRTKTTGDTPFLMAVAHYDQGRKDEASAICHNVLATRSDDIDSLRMLGVIARDAKSFDTALEWFERGLSYAPADPILWFEIGTAHFQRANLDRAAEAYRRAVQLKPDFQEAALNLAAILEQKENFQEALHWARRAVQLRPTCATARYNLANNYRFLGQLQTAVGEYRESLRLDPNNPKAHWNLAHTYLLQGDFANAWPEHEWRQAAGEVFFDRCPQPRWDGSSLTGKTLLVHAEQGVGDEVLFASCYDELVAQAGHCIFVCDVRLKSLLARSFPQATVHGYQRRRDWAPLAVGVPVDWQIPAGSVPLYLRRTATDFPSRRSYLQADSQAVARWRARFAELGAGLKIGISWRAGGRPSERRRRTTGLAEWQDLFALPGAHWINLQYGDTTDDVLTVAREQGVPIHDFAAGDPLVDLDEFAAKISALDLVVSVGNATVHLAGALGVPAWAILPPVPGWRWQIAGAASPWYESVRLYRQRTADGWEDVFAQVRADLLAALQPLNAAFPQQSEARAHMSRTVRVATTGAGRIAEGEMLRGVLDHEQFSDQALPAAMAKAVEHHQAGNFERAESIYREILHHLPRNSDAQRLLGLLACQTGRSQLAIASLRRALAAGDQFPETSIHLAASLLATGQFDEALAAYQDAASRHPGSAEAWLGLGKALAQAYRPDEALNALGEAIRLNPALAEAQHAMARVLLDDGLAADAVAACDAALAARRGYVAAWRTRALALQQLGRLADAADSLAQALTFDPQDLESRLGLAELSQAQGRLVDAEQAYRCVLVQQPGNLAALNNLGLVLQAQSRPAEADAMYSAAIDQDAHFAPARMNRALVRLQQGQLQAGWQEYHWRWRCPESGGRRDFFAQPLWDGLSLTGRAILVHGEQSLDDEVLFASCLPSLLSQAGQVVVTCDPRLAPLFARSFPAAKVFGVVRGREHLWRPPRDLRIDVQIPAGDLPGFLRSQMSSFPSASQFLVADPLRVAAWRKWLSRLGRGPKVGIAWRSAQNRHDRSAGEIPLEQWQPLLGQAGTQFVALQAGDCSQEISACQQAGGCLHVVPEMKTLDAVDERAALIAALDGVLAVGGTNLHLAGSLGTAAWALFPQAPSWPWLLHNDRIAWYPNVRVLRPTEEGGWAELSVRMQAEFLIWRESPRRQKLEEDAIPA